MNQNPAQNTYGHPLSQAAGDRWNGLVNTPEPNDAERFALELERVSARLLELNTLLSSKLVNYSFTERPVEAPKEIGVSVYKSNYFNSLGNRTDSMRLNLNDIDEIIKNLEI